MTSQYYNIGAKCKHCKTGELRIFTHMKPSESDRVFTYADCGQCHLVTYRVNLNSKDEILHTLLDNLIDEIEEIRGRTHAVFNCRNLLDDLKDK